MPYAVRRRLTFGRRVGSWFGLEDDWVRPAPRVSGADVALAALVTVLGLFGLELLRSLGFLEGLDQPRWVQWLAITVGGGLLLGRRRWPLLVAVSAAAHMFIVGQIMPEVMGQITLQVAYFVAFFSALAWARDRRLMVLVVGGIIVFMSGWIAWQLALTNAVSQLVARAQTAGPTGPVSAFTAGVILTVLINVVYFAGAVIGGQWSWRSARQRARLAEQAETITAQSVALQRQAVLDERLRIARELHDVVGHHVSLIGIQAGAARRVLTKDPAATAAALGHIETASRDAVTQMRSLVGTLRDLEAPHAGDPTEPHRAPEPTVADLPALVAERCEAGLDTAYDLVETEPGATRRLTGPQSLTLYRVAQEALANVARHSTARSARVVLRIVTNERAPFAEIEVLDGGRPRPDTAGSGLGQLGIRERVASLRGTVEIGPRSVGGYRVRVRVPLTPDQGGGASHE